ncbi:MAG: alpha/beta fold hydrolase [Nocardioidaceae bacterium]|nr:alpha/beta fold hydrolase [Nocardioidaceae bacterium]
MLLSHDDEGAGSVVVLLHSGVCDRRMWDAQVAALRDSFRVVVPDLRGFGKTPLPGERFAYATDVVELLDHLNIDQASLVGSSLGGRVAMEVATTAPERVACLVLLCPAYQGLEATAQAEAFDDAEDALLETGDIDGAVELNVSTWLGLEASDETRDLVRQMQRRAFEVGIAAGASDPAPELEKIDVEGASISARTLIVTGGDDMDHFQAIAAHLSVGIPCSELVTLPWAAHLPSLERPDEVTSLLIDFLP